MPGPGMTRLIERRKQAAIDARRDKLVAPLCHAAQGPAPIALLARIGLTLIEREEVRVTGPMWWSHRSHHNS